MLCYCIVVSSNYVNNCALKAKKGKCLTTKESRSEACCAPCKCYLGNSLKIARWENDKDLATRRYILGDLTVRVVGSATFSHYLGGQVSRDRPGESGDFSYLLLTTSIDGCMYTVPFIIQWSQHRLSPSALLSSKMCK